LKRTAAGGNAVSVRCLYAAARSLSRKPFGQTGPGSPKIAQRFLGWSRSVSRKASVKKGPGSSPASLRKLAQGVRRAVRLVLQSAGRSASAEVSVVLADDATVRALNCAYRGYPRTTDVLAFPQNGEGGLLGDVVISVPQAARQARRVGHSLQREVALLAIHGTLHLLGYEDDTARGRKAMQEVQDRLLRLWARKRASRNAPEKRPRTRRPG